MIYLPKRFQNENIEHSLKPIEEYPLATLVYLAMTKKRENISQHLFSIHSRHPNNTSLANGI